MMNPVLVRQARIAAQPCWTIARQFGDVTWRTLVVNDIFFADLVYSLTTAKLPAAIICFPLVALGLPPATVLNP